MSAHVCTDYFSIKVPLKFEKYAKIFGKFGNTILKYYNHIGKNLLLPAHSLYSSQSMELKLVHLPLKHPVSFVYQVKETEWSSVPVWVWAELGPVQPQVVLINVHLAHINVHLKLIWMLIKMIILIFVQSKRSAPISCFFLLSACLFIEIQGMVFSVLSFPLHMLFVQVLHQY